MPVALLYTAVVAIWGSSWVGIHYQIGVVAPDLSIAYRFVLAAGLLIAFCLMSRRSLRFARRDHLFFAAQGLTLFSLNYLLFYVAASYVASGLMAVAFSTITVMNIANGALLFRQRIDRGVAVGAVAGIAGLALVYWPEIAGVELSHEALLGLGLSVAATYSASLGNMISVRHKTHAIPVIESNAWGMGYGAAFAMAFALLRGAARVRLVVELHAVARLSGAVRLGVRFRRLSDAAAEDRRRPRRLQLGPVPPGGARPLDGGRRLSLDAACRDRRRPGAVGEPRGAAPAEAEGGVTMSENR